ncbi:hypothetical protein PFISCL1PPCAC_27862, partial [Pristionchus fissidentatus]
EDKESKLKFVADGIAKAKTLYTDPTASAIEQALSFIERVVRAGSTCQLMEIHLRNMDISVKNIKLTDLKERDDGLRQLVYVLIEAFKFAMEPFIECDISQQYPGVAQEQEGDWESQLDATSNHLPELRDPKLEEVEEDTQPVDSIEMESNNFNCEMPSTSQQQTMQNSYYEWMDEKIKQEDLIDSADMDLNDDGDDYSGEPAGEANEQAEMSRDYSSGLVPSAAANRISSAASVRVKSLLAMAALQQKKMMWKPVANEEGKYPCSVCDQTFYTKDEVCRHVYTHKKGVQCRVCKIFLDTQGELQYHTVMNHSHSCDICKKKFNTKLDLVRHCRAHERLPCPFCKSLLRTKQTLRQHLQVKHKGRTLPSKAPTKSKRPTARKPAPTKTVPLTEQ